MNLIRKVWAPIRKQIDIIAGGLKGFITDRRFRQQKLNNLVMGLGEIRFLTFMLLLAFVLFTLPGQTKDMFRSLATDPEHEVVYVIVFFGALLLWGISVA
ncbi:MAG: hypothetical protein D6730_01545, partial [Bacteroidetes bacterium]